MKKIKIKITSITCIILLIVYSFLPFIKVIAANDLKTIQFKDKNFYLAIIEMLENGDYKNFDENEETEGEANTEPYIYYEKDDNNLQIKMSQDDILKIEIMEFKNKGIKNISGIENFTNLKKFNIMNVKNDKNEEPNQVEDISYIKDLTNLKYICLDDNKISDISPVKNLKNLETLDICYNPIQEDINFIESLSNLKEIWLVGTNRKELPDLSKFPKLKSLYITDNQIKDINNVKKLTNLTTVNFNGNEIETTINKNGIQEIELPPILLDMKDEENILYTTENYVLNGCKLSEDGKNIIIDTEKVKKASVKLKVERIENKDNKDFIVFGDVVYTIEIKDEPVIPQEPTKPEENKTPTPSIKDNTQANLPLPKTGGQSIIAIITIIVVILGVGSYIQYKRYKRMK